ncbi:MAG: hypothetical protein RR766_04375, partial [Longicatena sp.]
SIHKEFEAPFNSNYEVLPELNVKELVSALTNLSKKDIICKLLHCLLYPETSKIPLHLILNVFGYETAIALWIITSKGMELKWQEL